MRPHGSPDDLERRRARAIDLLENGCGPIEVARMVGATRRSVRRWNAAYRRQGKNGIRAKPTPGRPPKLDAAARKRLVRALLKGARAAGFPTDLWTCPRVARLIRTQFGISYHVDHVGRLLRSLDWSPQRPERRAIERDERAIARWVKRDWLRIKEKPIA